MKNILMIINEEFPPGERAEKEAISLINEGYNLFVLFFPPHKNMN